MAKTGRPRIELQTGERFGSLTVTGNTKIVGHNILWECKCDCGNISYPTAVDLHRGHTTSCGKCLDKAYKTGLNYLYGRYKREAKRRGLSFSLTKDEFHNLIKQDCIYCGSPPDQVFFKNGMQIPFIYNGIDRADNSQGYELWNVVPCCKFCNYAKSRYSVSEFWVWIDRLTNHRLAQRGHQLCSE